MRKMVFGRKLSRGRKSREALLRSLIRALVEVGKIETTKAKAKAIQGQVDKLITLARKNTLSSRRSVLAYLANDRKTVDHLVAQIAPVFKDRKGGYTRIILLGKRLGDSAEMARLEWVEQITVAPKEEPKKAKKAKEESKEEAKEENKKARKSVKTVEKATKKVAKTTKK